MIIRIMYYIKRIRRIFLLLHDISNNHSFVMIKIHLSCVCSVYLMHFLYQLISNSQEFNLYKSTPLVNNIGWQLVVIFQSR